MNLLKNLFGKKESKTMATPPADPANDPNMIRVYDAYGRELYISRKDWRDSVLLENLKKAWNQPDELYQMILSALSDGFRSDIIDAARQLYKIDAVRVRGACLWAIVLMEEGRLDEAEKVLRDFIAKHGENSVILTNLAKVYSLRKDDAEAEEILWHSLGIDPNQDNGMGWYEAIHRERGGKDAGGLEALRRIAAIPSSWRAQLWLARAELESRHVDAALSLYEQALMQISGDLGNNGHLPEILRLCLPLFDPAQHGLQVGNNLIKAHLDLGQIDAARRIVDQLYALKRPDWQQHLSFWDTEIAKTHVDTQAEPPGEMKIGMVILKGPVWLRTCSPAAELFPVKNDDLPLICFLDSSAETGVTEARHQLSDIPGRVSRMIPLFLAEQLHWFTNAIGQILVPWLTSDAFVVSGVTYSSEVACDYARKCQPPADSIVVTHLLAKGGPWTVELYLYRTIDQYLLGSLKATLDPLQPEATLRRLTSALIALLAQKAEVTPVQPTPYYQVPSGADFRYYLLRLEQALAVFCGTMDGISSGFLHGEREVLDGNIQLSLNHPRNVTTRLLLAQTLLWMKKIRPDIVQEFRDKVLLLQRENPLAEPAQAIVQRIISKIFRS